MELSKITEDTIFAWKAGKLKIKEGTKLTFAISYQRFYNQAPANIRSMFNQRRRWISGTVNQLNVLPFRYRIYTIIRLVIWCLSPLLLLNGLVIYVSKHYINTYYYNVCYTDCIHSSVHIDRCETVLGL